MKSLPVSAREEVGHASGDRFGNSVPRRRSFARKTGKGGRNRSRGRDRRGGAVAGGGTGGKATAKGENDGEARTA